MKTVVVVGASLAGWRAAQELREQGFTGRLVVVGSERHRPYDRSPLSKEYLGGTVESDDLALGSVEDEDALEAEWLLGTSAVQLSPRTGTVVLDDGRRISADGVVIATGASRTTIAGGSNRPGCHMLHTLDDASALRDEVRAGARVVVVGGGLIGSEIASTCRSLRAQVTVVDAQHVPMASTLGIDLAPLGLALHEDHGVRVRCGTPAARVIAHDRVTGVELADGRVVPADTVVVEVGAVPATQWLRRSGVTVRQGVVTDAGCVTALPNVVAVGDVARYRSSHRNHFVRSDNWASAMNQPPVAVQNLLAGHTVAHYTGVPGFWSKQYGSTLQFAGYAGPKDKVQIVDGSVKARKFVATYQRAGRLVAIFAMNSPKQFAVHRRRLVGALRSGSDSVTRAAPGCTVP